MIRTIISVGALLFSFPAYAYIDPGLGSIILQSVVGGFAVAIGFISLYWQKFKSFISKFQKDHKDKKNHKK